jgi:hypothetical protein
MPSYIPEHVYGHPWPLHLARSQDIELTKKGEAYAEAADRVDNLPPPLLAEAHGVFFLTLNPNDRASIATTVERLINMLDAMDGDENLESTADEEPWLGWPGRGPSALVDDMAHDDREGEVYWTDAGPMYELEQDQCDDELSLGAPESVIENQETWHRSGYNGGLSDECEEENEHGGDINDEPQDGDELEEDSAEYDWGGGLIWGGNENEGRPKPRA